MKYLSHHASEIPKDVKYNPQTKEEEVHQEIMKDLDDSGLIEEFKSITAIEAVMNNKGIKIPRKRMPIIHNSLYDQ